MKVVARIVRVEMPIASLRACYILRGMRGREPAQKRGSKMPSDSPYLQDTNRYGIIRTNTPDIRLK